MEANCIVFSISPYSGCYRHVRVPLSYSFEDLHLLIQSIFSFDNDHMYSFFLSGKAWDEESEISIDDAEDEFLTDYAFAKGQTILYLFDYGDEWRFACKVLRYENAENPGPAILRSKGEAPKQYDWGDEDEDYDEEDYGEEDGDEEE